MTIMTRTMTIMVTMTTDMSNIFQKGYFKVMVIVINVINITTMIMTRIMTRTMTIMVTVTTVLSNILRKGWSCFGALPCGLQPSCLQQVQNKGPQKIFRKNVIPVFYFFKSFLS